MRLAALKVFLFVVFAGSSVPTAANPLLLMAEAPGCPWCALWDRDVSAIYPKTPEGRAAPLRRFNLRDGLPEGVVFARPVRYTPTFVLVHNGSETGRIEGYPGESFFWGLLGKMLQRAGIDIDSSDPAE